MQRLALAQQKAVTAQEKESLRLQGELERQQQEQKAAYYLRQIDPQNINAQRGISTIQSLYPAAFSKDPSGVESDLLQSARSIYSQAQEYLKSQLSLASKYGIDLSDPRFYQMDTKGNPIPGKIDWQKAEEHHDSQQRIAKATATSGMEHDGTEINAKGEVVQKFKNPIPDLVKERNKLKMDILKEQNKIVPKEEKEAHDAAVSSLSKDYIQKSSDIAQYQTLQKSGQESQKQDQTQGQPVTQQAAPVAAQAPAKPTPGLATNGRIFDTDANGNLVDVTQKVMSETFVPMSERNAGNRPENISIEKWMKEENPVADSSSDNADADPLVRNAPARTLNPQYSPVLDIIKNPSSTLPYVVEHALEVKDMGKPDSPYMTGTGFEPVADRNGYWKEFNDRFPITRQPQQPQFIAGTDRQQQQTGLVQPGNLVPFSDAKVVSDIPIKKDTAVSQLPAGSNIEEQAAAQNKDFNQWAQTQSMENERAASAAALQSGFKDKETKDKKLKGQIVSQQAMMSGLASPVKTPTPAIQTSISPTKAHIDHLIQHRELASDFDAKFGEGASKKYLTSQ